MANKVKYGLRNVYYAKLNSDGTYETPVRLLGGVSLSLTKVGDIQKFYADDVEFFVSSNNLGYEGTIEIAMLNDTFKKDILGQKEDANGTLFENADDTISPFALGFEVQGDDKPRRAWFYNCTCTRPDTNATTKGENIEPQTDTLNITCSPRVSDRQVKGVMTKTAQNETAFNSFFVSVYEYVAPSI